MGRPDDELSNNLARTWERTSNFKILVKNPYNGIDIGGATEEGVWGFNKQDMFIDPALKIAPYLIRLLGLISGERSV